MLSVAFSYARYANGKEELTGFVMKNSLNLPSFENKNFNSLRDENDEVICTCNDEFMRHFVKQSIRRGRCSALNQYYKSNIPDEVFNIILKELDINDNVCEMLETSFDYTYEHTKI